MNKLLRWLAASVGYLLYTALVLVLLLWFLLPAEGIRLWLQAQLNAASPDLRWEIKALHAALPASLVATGVRLQAAGKSGEDLLQVTEVQITPDLGALFAAKGEFPFRYQLKAMDGGLRGKASLREGSGKLRCEGEVENLQLSKLTQLWTMIGRSVTGKMSGHYQFEGDWRQPYQGVLTADLRVAEGTVSLQQPVFGLDQLEFSQLTGSLELRERALALTKGKLESRLLAAEYSGTVTLAESLPVSEVKIDGSLEPRSELLSGLRDQAVVALIKKELRDNKLSFALTGTMLEPGIQFLGGSGAIDGIIQGGER